MPTAMRLAVPILVLLLLAAAMAGCSDGDTGVVPTGTPSPAKPLAPSSAQPTPGNPGGRAGPATNTRVPRSPTLTALRTATLTPVKPTATSEPASTPTPVPTVTPTATAVPTLEPTTASVAPATTDLVTRVAPGQGEVALSFNADSFAGHITSILDTLGAHDTHLTFFLTGGYLERYPEQVQAIDAAGNEIASHGYDHIDYRDLSDEQIAGRLDRWREKLRELTGKTGPTYWQPPYGYSNARIRQAAFDQGYTTIYWTLDVLDSVGQPKSKAFVLDRVLGTGSVELDGAIILMHVDKDGTVAALPEILDALAQRGLRAVTISELLNR